MPKQIFSPAIGVFAAVLLSACGGGSDNNNRVNAPVDVSGTVVVVEPVAEVAVEAKCSNGKTYKTKTDGQGRYSMKPPGDAYPCALRAQNAALTAVSPSAKVFYGLATVTGVSNLSPTVQLAMGWAVGEPLKTWYANYPEGPTANLGGGQDALRSALVDARYLIANSAFNPFGASLGKKDAWSDLHSDLLAGLASNGSSLGAAINQAVAGNLNLPLSPQPVPTPSPTPSQTAE